MIARRVLQATALIGLIATSAALIAGPLNPPPGAVAPSYRTLSEVQPSTPVQALPISNDALYLIAQPGSYYLTGNITGAAGKNGIRVVANDVTIDLAGFALDGAGVGLAAINAVGDNGPVAGLCVRNGAVSNWISAGVYAPGSTGSLFESLRARSTGESGIRTGAGSVVHACAFQGGQTGVIAEAGAHIVDCSSTSASTHAFVLGDGSSAAQCSAYTPGAVGFRANGHNASILDCVSRGGAIGIQLASGGNRVERCKIGNAPIGIESQFANTIVGNTINANTAGQGEGIRLVWGENRVESNHLYAFETGIRIYGVATNVVTGNTMHACTTAISAGAYPMVAPVITTAAALATNPKANIAQ